MKLDSNSIGYEHIIGICPQIASKGSPVQYRIVDGDHPQLQSIEYSLENLNWCCGGSFTCITSGFVFVSGRGQTRIILDDLRKYRNVDELKKSGLTIFLGIDSGFKIPCPFSDMNIARKNEYYDDIIVKNAGLIKK